MFAYIIEIPIMNINNKHSHEINKHYQENQFKDPVCEIIGALKSDNLDDIKILTEKWSYYLNIRHAYQNLQLDTKKGQLKCFMKVYVMTNNQWVPHDYGNLYKNKFVSDGALHLFQLEDLPNRIQRHHGSDKHLVVIDNNTNKYLLYNPYPEIITTIMRFYRKLI